MDSFKTQPIYPHGKNAGTHSIAEWVVPTPRLEVLEKSKIFVLARIQTPDCPAHILIHIQTTPCLRKSDHTQHTIFLSYYTYSKFCSFSDSKNFHSVISYLKMLQSHFNLQNYQISVATQHSLQNLALLCITYLIHDHMCHIKMQYQMNIKQLSSTSPYLISVRSNCTSLRVNYKNFGASPTLDNMTFRFQTQDLKLFSAFSTYITFEYTVPTLKK